MKISKTINPLIVLLISLIFLTSCSIFSEQELKPKSIEKKPQVNTEKYPYLQKLNSLKGRAAGTKWEKDAASIIAKQFTALKIEPLLKNNSFYFQNFKIPETRSSFRLNDRLKFKATGKTTISSQNVVGFLPGKQKKYVILSAHYDGQGVNFGKIYPSANDNLSGITLMLETAAKLAQVTTRNLTYVFVAFGAEEIGLYGSEFFVRNLPVPKEDIMGVINLDTVSTDENKVTLHSELHNDFTKSFELKLQEYDFQIIPAENVHRSSDQSSFNTAGIPAVTLLAADWVENNHTPQDTLDKLNFSTINNLQRALMDTLLTLDEQSKK